MNIGQLAVLELPDRQCNTSNWYVLLHNTVAVPLVHAADVCYLCGWCMT